MGKMETPTTCKIEFLEQIVTKFVTGDYADERNVWSNSIVQLNRENPFTSVIWERGGI